jgi:diguanylate cyclase (GGDEF)-like protein
MHAISPLEQLPGGTAEAAGAAALTPDPPRRTLRQRANLCGSAVCGRDGPIAYVDLAVIGVGLMALLAVGLVSDRYFDAACMAAFALGSLCVLEMARNLRSFVADDYPLFLALSLFVVAALLVLHATEMPGIALFGHSNGRLSAQAQLAAGVVMASAMLIAPLTLGRRLRAATWAAALAPVAALSAAAILFWQVLPVAKRAGDLTGLGNATVVAVSVALAGAMLLTYRRRRLLDAPFLIAMEVALGVAALAWLLKAVFPSDDVGHMMDVTFIALTYVAVTKNGLARPTLLMVAELRMRGQRAQDLIDRLAFYDSLTGLANRSLLHDRLRRALASAARADSPLAVLHVDLDRFADVNHLLGRRGADRVLQQMATRLQSIVRETDTVARLAADEFILLLPDVEGTEAVTRVAAEIGKALHSPAQIEGRKLTLSASVGAALFPGDGDDHETLLEHAVIATQRAKAGGGDRLQFYDPAMGQAVEQRVRLEQELRAALDRDELVLFYQPQVDLTSGQIVGVEALVRWQHPERGLLAPDAFLPVAEALGLIEQLTVWVAGQACRQAIAWQAAGIAPLRVAINVSACDFRSGHVPKLVDDALAASGLAPEWLEVELTETAVVDDVESTAAQLAALRARGVSVALDDFGTGFSSLTHLRALPINRVKIDRSFVSRVGSDGREAAIVASMIQLIHSLDFEAIGEGVESTNDLDYLIDHGCDVVQGYLFSRPLPADECAALFGRDLIGAAVVS